MGRKGITNVDVVQAYVALLKQGRKPSLINLRLQLGWGSYASISQHLRRLALRQVALQAQRTCELSHARARGDAPASTRLGMPAAEVMRL
jgi:hypothetical protein